MVQFWLVCYTAVSSVVTQGRALRDGTKNGCVPDWKTVSCCLLERMDTDWNLKKLGQPSQVFKPFLKNHQQILWLVFPDEIPVWYLLHKEVFCVWVMTGKGIKCWLQHRIDLKQQHACDVAPLNSSLIYSRTSTTRTRITRIPHQPKPTFLSLDHISLKFTPITRTVFRFLSEFELPEFYCKIIRNCT